MIRIVMMALVVVVLGEKTPRLKFIIQEPWTATVKPEPPRFHFTKPENYMAVHHQEGTDVLHVGGQAVIYTLTFTDRGVRDTQIPVLVEEKTKQTCISESVLPKLECDNFIMVIEKVNDTFVVCGTNAGSPKCWLLVNNTVLIDVPQNGQMMPASDICPPSPSQRFVSLTADGSLYSGLSAVASQPGSIRRTYSSSRLLRTESKWLQNPEFAGAAVIPAEHKYKEEIYFFFSEVNNSASVDEEPYRARIGRVCMFDEGGIKNILENSWTTFLKARVMCGTASSPQQYNNIRRAFVLPTKERAGVLYGLFSNAWDTTVVCAYYVEDIDQAFATSKLKGYNIPLTGHRPGVCAYKNMTAHNPRALGVIKDHPELENVIWPVGGAPLDLPTEDHFTHIVADRVLAVNDDHYSVVYLGTEQGKVLKVLHTINEAFIISQYSLFHNEGPVLKMAIDSQKGHLYVGTAMEVQRFQLADCSRYGDSCRECILSRDPYCGWNPARKKCTAIPKDYNISTGTLVQSLEQSNASVCGETSAQKSRKTTPKDVHLSSAGPVLLACPVRSYHATYHWERDNSMKRYTCTISGASCILAPPAGQPLEQGVFRCVATEHGLKQEVVSYRLVYNGGAAAASPGFTLVSSVLLAATILWLL